MFAFLSPSRAKQDKDTDSESGNDVPAEKIADSAAGAKVGMESGIVKMVKSFDSLF